MKNIQSLEKLDNQTASWDEYEQWEKDFKGRPAYEAMQALEKHPDKIGIKKAHDLQLIWQWWLANQAETVRPSLHPKKAERYTSWNNWTEEVCNWLIKKPRNPFQDSCTIPDWRTPEMIEADNKALKAIGKEPE